jgi:putative membrane protein insertion efficiency factor
MKMITITGWISKILNGKTLMISAFFLCFSFMGFAQKSDIYGIQTIKDLFEVHEHKTPKYKSNNAKPKNESEFIMASGFNIYKGFFSSQDNPSCVFHPSCSEYSVQALQQKGLFLGTLYTFDRLSRCHRFVKPGQYVLDPSKQRFYDSLH